MRGFVNERRRSRAKEGAARTLDANATPTHGPPPHEENEISPSVSDRAWCATSCGAQVGAACTSVRRDTARSRDAPSPPPTSWTSPKSGGRERTKPPFSARVSFPPDVAEMFGNVGHRLRRCERSLVTEGVGDHSRCKRLSPRFFGMTFLACSRPQFSSR